MAKPKRTFSADVGQYSVGTAGPDQIEYDLDNLFNMLNPSALLKDGTQGGIGPDNMSDRFTVDQSQSPTSNQGKLHLLVGRIANRIRAILGLDDWKKDPPITLKAAKEHVDDLDKHSGISNINDLGTPGGAGPPVGARRHPGARPAGSRRASRQARRPDPGRDSSRQRRARPPGERAP